MCEVCGSVDKDDTGGIEQGPRLTLAQTSYSVFIESMTSIGWACAQLLVYASKALEKDLGFELIKHGSRGGVP